MAENKRLIEVIAFLKEERVIYNESDFAKQIEIGKSFLSDIKAGRKPLSEQNVLKICALDTRINSEWLLTGEGSMFNDRPTVQEEEEHILVPLLPISAQGGSLNDFVTSVNVKDCEKIISPIKGADIAITISGDSMADEYPSGSIVLAKRINERAFIDWGKVYVLDTCNGVVVKTLTPSQKEDCVRCVSINPNPIYAPFEVALNDIYGVYRVMLCMAKK